MPYVIPAMPLVVNVWRNGNPTTNPPDVITIGNLSPGKRVFLGYNPIRVGAQSQLLMELLIPPRIDVRGPNNAGGADVVECPAGTARFYEVVFVDDIGKGFPNEHRLVIMGQSAGWPNPIP